ncbi:MAG TPA: alpha/beta hydrolase, partial [Pseudolabrys sp.]|nr:alpha/beta hydrolase [Pseudolabrys sp.]
SDERIVKVHAPLLVLHGEQDRIVPIGSGERLFALAHEPKTFVRFASGGHVDLDQYGAMDAVRKFLAEHFPPGADI